MIKARGIDSFYGKNNILHNINIHIKRGEFTVVIGPNGSGKTTLLAMVTGMIGYKGSLILDGITANKKNLPGLRQRIGLVPQNWRPDARIPVSVQELLLSARIGQKGFFRYFTRSDYRDADEMAAKLGIGKLAKRPVGQLSGGEFQRALIGRALLQNPVILLLDEPVSNLDWQAGSKLMHMIYDFHREKQLTTILVTHDLSMIPYFADHVIIMRSGSIVADGKPEEVFKKEVFKNELGWCAPY